MYLVSNSPSSPMELPLFTNSSLFGVLTSSPKPSLLFFFLHRRSFRRAKFDFGSVSVVDRHPRIAAASDAGGAEWPTSSADFWSDSDSVEVIGIGSRKDAVLNFCLQSPFHSSSLRYWNVFVKDSVKVQLQQRVLEKDPNPRTYDALPSLSPSSKTIVLVASAGYGLDHKLVIDILKTARSANGFTVAIILKPFSFEGQRRQDEVKVLMEELQEQTNLFIDLDTDKLLKKDLVTLDEAVKTANNAVLMAITAVSALKSDLNHKLIGSSHNNVKDIEVSEVFRILERFKDAKLAFGAGYNIRSSILQSIYNCPFLRMGVTDLDGTILCVLSSSYPIRETDIDSFLHNFRQTTLYKKDILLSTIHEPNLEPNLFVTTVLVFGFTIQEASQKIGILTRLAQHFPFIRRLFPRGNSQSSETQGSNGKRVQTSVASMLPEGIVSIDAIAEGVDNYSEKLQTEISNSDNYYDESLASSESERNAGEFFEAEIEPSDFQNPAVEVPLAFQREELVSWNSGLGYQIAQEWAKERATEAGASSTLDKLSIFRLPVGVRPAEELKDRFNIPSPTQNPTSKNEDFVKSKLSVDANTPSLNELTDTGLEAVKDFYNTASALLKGNPVDPPKKHGILSARAASMLEAERDSPKKWSPTVEMKYRGGIYKGRCQGGLPEGKGRLVLGDGSIYDGIWRYGKRSGSGTLYFSSGDVFQGSWRDDVMHGKGWFYFHTGDRWFANFWKGKANGEGRFYSKSGDVFFGHFQDGWRHGKFICIDVDGQRCVENWDHGVLVNRTQFDR